MTLSKRLFFSGLMVLFVSSQFGCADLITSSERRFNGKTLRQGADFTNPYPRTIENPLFLDHTEWTCFQGTGKYLGKELCLLPDEAKQFDDQSWFHCEEGRGGEFVRVATFDRTLYCTLTSSASHESGASMPDKRDRVAEVQDMLANKNYDPGPVDGVWGGKSAAALKAYQADNNLPPTGIIDEDTYASLKGRK